MALSLSRHRAGSDTMLDWGLRMTYYYHGVEIFYSCILFGNWQNFEVKKFQIPKSTIVNGHLASYFSIQMTVHFSIKAVDLTATNKRY